ncbi:MAG TPA: ATP-binding protein, partial [Methanocorpusculum sp.]|nr:ATP-binding protein [Methanocorpusculum sp.]
HVVECGTDKVLKTSAVYGANASGKSNLYRAFEAMQGYVLQSLNFGGDIGSAMSVPDFSLAPFVLDMDSRKKEIPFEVFFYHADTQHSYNYGFSIDSVTRIIREEWLNSKAKTQRKYRQVFYRAAEHDPEFLSEDISAEQQKIIRTTLNPETLLVSLGAKLKIRICELVYRWFARMHLLDYGNPQSSASLLRMMPQKFLENDPDEIAEAVRFISTFDTSINGFESRKVEENQISGGGYTIFAKHRMNDSAEETLLPFNLESAGTQKMLSLYDPIRNTLREGGVLIIDEMNDQLHPLLQRSLILLFLDPGRNPKNAQLIFTTHDVTLLATNLLRRDEIWIVEKDRKENSSELYAITDFKNDTDKCIRKYDCLWKRFLMGEYGGVPQLGKMLIPGLEEIDAE